MKGLVVGILYTSVAIFMPTFVVIQVIFKNKSFTWRNGVISCGFWYFITKLSLLSVLIIILFVVMKLYKKRKREDVLPNEQIFAERYYSKP